MLLTDTTGNTQVDTTAPADEGPYTRAVWVKAGENVVVRVESVAEHLRRWRLRQILRSL